MISRVNFNEVVDFLEGPGVRKWQFRDSGIKLINIRNLVEGKLDLSNTKNHLDESEVSQKYSHFLLENGDYVMASSGVTWGKIAEVKEEHLPLCLNTSIIKLKPINNNLEKRFLWHFIRSREFRKQIDRIITGSAQPNFGPSHLHKISIPLPPVDQQKKIASILDAADSYRQKTKALIEKYDELTLSLFLDMFGDPVSNPKGWDKVLFSEIATFHNGDRGKNYPSQSAFIKKGIPFINAGNLSNYAIDNQGLNFISNERFDLLSSGKIKREDILFCLRGSLGKFAVNRTHDIGAIASSLVLIRINNHVTLDYITGLLKTNYIAGLIKKSDNGSSQPNLSAKSVKQFIVPLPSLELQNQFSERVQAIEAQKAQAEASLAQAEDLFNSLLQRAFKGELTKT